MDGELAGARLARLKKKPYSNIRCWDDNDFIDGSRRQLCAGFSLTRTRSLARVLVYCLGVLV